MAAVLFLLILALPLLAAVLDWATDRAAGERQDRDDLPIRAEQWWDRSAN